MKKSSAATLGVGLVAAALALAGCTSNGSGSVSSGSTQKVTQAQITKAMNTPTTITFWDWAPGLNDEVAAFEKKYPKIKVSLVNAGQGGAEYTKLQSAVSAGKGAPDAVQLEYSELPQFLVTNSLLDLTPYGANSIKSLFTDAAWSGVDENGGVWGIPQDSGPMTLMYRTDLFQKAGITQAPATWADFATDAAAVKAKTGAFIADIAPGEASQTIGLLQQAGATPFAYDGKKTVTINLTSPQVKEVADFMTQLIQSGEVATDADFTNDWYQGFAKNKYASWAVGAWGPDDLTGTAANTSGKWTAAPLPQWTAGANVGGDWGGSSDAVMKTSAHPIVAYEFIKFLNSNAASAAEMNSNPKSALFPTTLSTLNSSSFLDQKTAFFNGQQANQVFANIEKTVSPSFQYLPYSNYASTAYTNTVGKAITAKTDIFTAMKAWQNQLVSYGKSQGFTVKVG